MVLISWTGFILPLKCSVMPEEQSCVRHDFYQEIYVNISYVSHRHLKTCKYCLLSPGSLSTKKIMKKVKNSFLLYLCFYWPMVWRRRCMFSVSKHFKKWWWFHIKWTKEHYVAVQMWHVATSFSGGTKITDFPCSLETAVVALLSLRSMSKLWIWFVMCSVLTAASEPNMNYDGPCAQWIKIWNQFDL